MKKLVVTKLAGDFTEKYQDLYSFDEPKEDQLETLAYHFAELMGEKHLILKQVETEGVFYDGIFREKYIITVFKDEDSGKEIYVMVGDEQIISYDEMEAVMEVW
jgi:hypothetical protein